MKADKKSQSALKTVGNKTNYWHDPC